MKAWLAVGVLPLALIAQPSPARSPSEPSAVPGLGTESSGTTNAAVPRLVGPGRYAIGQVTLNQTRRTVSFPAAVNQRAGLIEYLVVTTTGKIHESVFRTAAQPQHIHVAMLLLGAKPANTNAFSEDLRAAIPGEPVTIEAVWKRNGREVRHPLEDFVKLTEPAPAFKAGRWVYNGSFVFDGAFVAQLGGSIVALQTDPTALINNPRPDRDNDEIHFVNPKTLPPDGTQVEIVIHAFPGQNRPPSPGAKPGPAKPREAGAGRAAPPAD